MSYVVLGISKHDQLNVRQVLYSSYYLSDPICGFFKAKICSSLLPEINHTWSWCRTLLMAEYSLSNITNMLFRIFASLLIWDTSLWLSFWWCLFESIHSSWTFFQGVRKLSYSFRDWEGHSQTCFWRQTRMSLRNHSEWSWKIMWHQRLNMDFPCAKKYSPMNYLLAFTFYKLLVNSLI